MQLSFQSLQQWTAQQAAAIQGACSQLVDFSVGSVLYAITQSNAAVAAWFQWLLLLVLQTTRLATSTGSDIDSFLADFGVTRLQAVAATGQVTLSRYSATAAASVPVGATVRTGDLSVSFAILADTTNPAYSAALFNGSGGYLIAANVQSLTVNVQATTAGTVGNVQIGAISLMGSSTPGVDTVTNAAAFVNGVNAQSDAQARSLFPAFIASRAKATLAAIQYAISTTQQGLSSYISECVDEAGRFFPGKVICTIDNGTGAPPQSLISAVYASVDAVRAAGVMIAVHAPTVLPIQVSLVITVGPGGVKANLQPLVQQAVQTYVNTLSVGALCSITQIAQTAYAVHPSITNVSGITLINTSGSQTTDLAAAPMDVIKATSVAVN
jgi:hypothetical protein